MNPLVEFVLSQWISEFSPVNFTLTENSDGAMKLRAVKIYEAQNIVLQICAAFQRGHANPPPTDTPRFCMHISFKQPSSSDFKYFISMYKNDK